MEGKEENQYLKEDDQYLLVFISNNYGILIYNELLKENYTVELISTPCIISSGCSQSIRFTEKDLPRMVREMKRNTLCIKGIYKILKKGNKEEYVPYCKCRRS